MDYYKKEKVRNWFAKHWKPVLATGIFVTAAIVAMLIGFAMAGWDLLKWLKSDYAETFFIVVALGAIGLAVVIYVFHILRKKKEY